MKRFIFYCIALAMLITSCSNEETEKTFLSEISTSRIFDLSEHEVLDIVQTFQKSISKQTRSENVTFSIKNKYLIDSERGSVRKSTDEEIPLLYEIEMDNGINKGQILVSGDKRFPKVLTYMPVYNDSLYKLSPEPKIMTQIARNTLLKEIENYKKRY